LHRGFFFISKIRNNNWRKLSYKGKKDREEGGEGKGRE